MDEQPEALRLANGLQQQAIWERHYGPSHLRDLLLQAEAELRRLHAVNQELLESLKDLTTAQDLNAYGMALHNARAAIAKAKGEKT